MANEIRRNGWSRFCRKFSASNQYRAARVSLTGQLSEAGIVDGQFPFMGIMLAKKGRLIDGIQLYAGRGRAEAVSEPVLTVKEPARVVLEKDEDGTDTRLTITAKDGSEATVELTGANREEMQRELVGQVAYSLYQRRGCNHGHDQSDWIEAEQRVHSAELSLIE